MSEKLMRIFYDRKGDVLYISIDTPREAISKETEDDILIRMDPMTHEIIGFTILNFAERFSDIREERAVPVTARFQMMENIKV